MTLTNLLELSDELLNQVPMECIEEVEELIENIKYEIGYCEAQGWPNYASDALVYTYNRLLNKTEQLI